MEKLEQLKQGSVKFNCERHDGRVHPRGRAEVMWLHFEWTIRRKQSRGGWVSEHVLPVRRSPLSETDCSRLPPVTVKTKSTAGRPAALRYELLSVSSWAQVVKLQGCANKRRHTAHEPKAKLSRWLKWKCTTVSGSPDHAPASGTRAKRDWAQPELFTGLGSESLTTGHRSAERRLIAVRGRSGGRKGAEKLEKSVWTGIWLLRF